MSGLGLDTANRSQGFEPIPAGTTCVLVMKIKPGNTGIDGLCKRSSKGDSEGLDVEYVVKGDEYDKRKIYAFHLLDGVTSGHAKAGEITRSLLRAIYEAVHAIDPNDDSPEAISRRASASLADFNGATFLAELGIERGGEKPDGGNYPDKNVITQGAAPSVTRATASLTSRRRPRSSVRRRPFHRTTSAMVRQRWHRPRSQNRPGRSDHGQAQNRRADA